MPHPAVRPVARPAVLGASRTPTPGNRGTEIAQPVARPAVLGASRTLTPGNRGTKIAGSGSVDT